MATEDKAAGPAAGAAARDNTPKKAGDGSDSNTDIAYSRGKNTFDAYPEQRTAASFEAFAAALLTDRSRKKGEAYICAPLRANGDGRHHRGKNDALPRRWLALDCDGCDPETFGMLCLRSSEYRGVGWMTASSTRECPRFRGVLALSRPVDRTEGMRLGMAVEARLSAGLAGIKWDPSVYRAEQPAFLPLHGAESITWEGEPLDVDKLLAEAPPVMEKSGKRGRAEKIASADPVVQRLSERVMVKRDHGDGKLSIVCPFESSHSEPGGESSTVYMLAHFNGVTTGRFHCFHAHCAERRQLDFLAAIGLAARPNPITDTDIANARRFAQKYGADIRFTPERGWVVWDGRHWAVDDLNQVVARAKEVACAIFDELKDADPDGQKTVFHWARKSQSAERIRAMLFLSQTEPGIPARWTDFDADPWLLSCANGTLDLRTGTLRAHDRADYLCRGTGVAYDPAAPCPLWEGFLERVIPDAEVRAYLQRAAGYSLTGRIDEQCLFFCHGVGANGKTVLIEILALNCGDYALSAVIETFTIQKQRGIPNDIARLAGARMVMVPETEDGQRLRESLIKELTGGDMVTARFLNREFFDFRPHFKLWFRGNHKPQIRGTDDGIWRRVHLIPFTVKIPEPERDRTLFDRLKAELSGIFAWAVRGCLAWQTTGLAPPKAVLAATRKYREEMDTLGDFLTERCVMSPEATVRAGKLYQAYRVWSEHGGLQPTSQTRFGLSLGERGFAKGDDKYGVYYKGIRLRGAG